MKLNDRINKIQEIESQRLANGKIDLFAHPWTSKEKDKLIRISCIGSNFIGWDSPIYSYVKFEYFKDYWMRPNGKWSMVFSNPNKFPDPFDSLIYKVPVKNGKSSFASQDLLLKDVYISCWTKCIESELHWNAYGRTEESVCLVSTPRKIMSCIYDFDVRGSYNYFFVGNVVYKDVIEVQKSITRTTLSQYQQHDYCVEKLFLKTKEHTNEKEIRFVFYNSPKDGKSVSSKWTTTSDSKYASASINCNKAFDKIILNPKLTTDQSHVISSEIRNNGFTNTIDNSTLYEDPRIYIDITK